MSRAIAVRRTIPVFFLLVVLSANGPRLLYARGRAKSVRPVAGASMPDFSFTDLAGRTHRLSDFAGKYVLLDFWATWCPPCIQEMGTLKKAYGRYSSRGLEIIGMNSDKKAQKARRFVEENRIPWLQSSPQSTRAIIRHELKIPYYPTLIVLGPRRKILLVSGDGKPVLGASKLFERLNRLLPAASAAARSRTVPQG